MLASNPNNIRFNGTGRAYIGAVGGSSLYDIGELSTFNFGIAVTTEKITSTRNADRATLMEVETSREATLSIGIRELAEENLQMAYLGSAINQDNQAKGFADQVVPGYVDNQFVDLGHLNVHITKITGAITGSITVGAAVTGATSGSTAKVAFVAAGYVILVNVSAAFTSGENVEVDGSNYIVATSIETLEDVCVTDSTGATLRVQGDDYALDPDYGMLRKESDGDIEATDVCSYDYAAVERKYIHGMSAGSVEKKVVMVTDKDDLGPRKRYTYHRVKLAMNGDMPLIGDGEAVPTIQGTVLKDTSQPSGQEYFKVEIMPKAA